MPQCNRATYLRKFPLLIHIYDFSLIVLGKTCRYCSKCEFIIVHKDGLEHELTAMFPENESQIIDNDFFVIGTVEKKAWRQGLSKQGTLADILPYTSDIKEHIALKYESAGWVPEDK